MGLLDKANAWMTPERAIAMQGLGMGLSQMAYGQPVDLSPAYAAMDERRQNAQMRKVMDTPGLMDKFTPQQRAVLASRPEAMATKSIMESAFEPPPEPTKYEYREGPDGSLIALDPYNPGAVQTVMPGQPEPQARQMTLAQFAQEKGLPMPPGRDPNEIIEVMPDGNASPLFGGGVTVENNMPGDVGKYDEFSARAAAERHGTIVAEAQNAQRLMGDMKTLAAIGTQIETGKLAEAKMALGPYAEAVGIDISGLGEAQAYQAIIDRLAPQMRPAGSGATSDFDARQFLNSLPQLANNPEGNLIIQQTFDAIAMHKQAAAEIVRRSQMGEITWQQADAEIAKLGDPYEAFNEYKKKSGQSGGAGAGSYTPKGVIRYDAQGNKIP